LDDRFEWDEVKRLANLEKHQIDFIDMQEIFDGRATVEVAGNSDVESRHLTTGSVDGKLYSVVWTQRDSRIRIISARRARDGEERTYRQLHGE
jgi:uncharacterized DUF497 family protein